MILAVAFAIGFVFGWLMRDSTIPVPEYKSPDGTYPKNEGG